MNSASKIYCKAIYDHFSLLGIWMPNAAVAIGDVGVMDQGFFKRLTSLRNLQIPFEISSGTSAIDFSLTSDSGVEFQTNDSAQLLPSGAPLATNIGLSVKFSKEGGFVFQAVDCFVDEVKDSLAMGRAIIALYRIGKWEKEWGVIDTIVRTGSATIIVSQSSNAALELAANIPVQAANLARANLGLSVKSQNGDVVRFISQKGMTPLFRLSRVKTSMFGNAGRIRFGGAPAKSSSSIYEKFFDSVAPD